MFEELSHTSYFWEWLEETSWLCMYSEINLILVKNRAWRGQHILSAKKKTH